MKKLICICAIAASAMATSPAPASPSEAVAAMANKMLPSGASASANKMADLGDGWQSVEVSIKDASGAVVGNDLLFSNGRFITPLLIDAKSGKDYKAEYEAEQQKKTAQAIKAALPEYVKTHKNIVKLGDKGGLATVVFTDPDCPFCRRHLAGLEEELKKHDVLMILTPLPMHKNALNKAALLLDEVTKLGAKATTEAKLAVFKKYFADGEFKDANAAAKDELSKAVEEAFAIGVSYTPAIFEDIKL